MGDRPAARRSATGTRAFLTALLAGLVVASCALRSTVPHRGDEQGGEEPEAHAIASAPVPASEPAREATDAALEAWIVAQNEAEEEEAPPDPAQAAPGEETSASPLDTLGDVEAEASPEALERSRELVESAVPQFDIPIVVNEPVTAWIDLYTTRYRDAFQAGLVRAGRYLPMFRRIYEEEGLPLDLIHMAHVESGFKTSAYSRAHARGIFQFIASTARLYGLRVDYWVDERVDPEKSARASAAYLKKLYRDFGDWHLVLAAYNAGEGKIQSGMRRSGATDFWALRDTRYIRRETKNHVPAILAATLIAKEPEKYGFVVDRDPEMVYDTIRVEGAADLRVLAQCAGTEVEVLRDLNPALRRLQTPPNAVTEVRVPPGTGDATLAALAEVPPDRRVLYVRHPVRSGDTLSAIARAHGVTVRAIQQANGMGNRTMIRVGQTLTIPTSDASAGSYANGDDADLASGPGESVVHRVRRGDTLSGIARSYRTSAATIAAANGISLEKTLHVGERLKVFPGVRDPRHLPREGSSGNDLVASSNGQPRVHTVRRGESLWSIAQRYRTTIEALCGLNGIARNAVLHPGTRLTIAP